MTLKDLDKYLKTIFDFDSCSLYDSATNGIEVENEGDLENIIFAVDANLSTIEKLPRKGNDALIVHHGLFWGDPQPITGTLYKKTKMLLESNTGLYALHLPLDTHPIYGNNAKIASLLELEGLSQSLPYKDLPLGFVGSIKREFLVKKLLEYFPLSFSDEKKELIHSFSKDSLKVGISSGAFSSKTLHYLLKNPPLEIDLILTGEVSLGVFNEAKDASLLIIPLGHYYTEAWGIKSLMEFMRKEYPSLNFYFIGDDKFI